jgi:hypothetical protein
MTSAETQVRRPGRLQRGRGRSSRGPFRLDSISNQTLSADLGGELFLLLDAIVAVIPLQWKEYSLSAGGLDPLLNY